jgi:GxxExxY protein
MDDETSWHSFEEPGDEANRFANLVIGAAIEVHRHLGPGQKESIYKLALCHELELRGIKYQREASVAVLYKGKEVGCGKADLIVGGLVIVELKAVEQIIPLHVAQAISYLRMTNLRLALIINFNVPVLKQGIRRVVLS